MSFEEFQNGSHGWPSWIPEWNNFSINYMYSEPSFYFDASAKFRFNPTYGSGGDVFLRITYAINDDPEDHAHSCIFTRAFNAQKLKQWR